jgi:iron complex transport system permease protein
VGSDAGSDRGSDAGADRGSDRGSDAGSDPSSAVLRAAADGALETHRKGAEATQTETRRTESLTPGVAQATSSLRARLAATLLGFGALALAVCLLTPLVGSTTISLSRVFDRAIPFEQNVDAQIFFLARLPRVAAGALVGATLAAAGVVFQALLRNPLATPFTLGVSAGASLGAMLAIIGGASLALGPLSPVPLASLAGAALASTIVYWLATPWGRAMSTSVLLLAGVTLNSFFSALIMFLQYIADFAQVYRAARWLMGDLDVGGFPPLLAVLPLVALAFLMFALLPSSLNLLSVGEDAAAARGVDVVRAHRLAFLSASLATSAAVALAGPIGFIGIVVPHLVRLMVGVDHRIVLPASALFGAAFLVACDLAARTLLAPVEIPVGVVTALVGGPFFLWLLVRRG